MDRGYKITIIILLAIIAIQGLYILKKTTRTEPETTVAPARVSHTVIPRTPRKPQVTEETGRIAIVLDDWGYNENNLELMEQIRFPLTVAVLPNLPYSKNVAETLHAKGREIILHLPMEPKNGSGLENNTIMVGMDNRTIAGIVDNAVTSFPYIKGVSNHMGSKATENLATMTAVAGELREKNMYILDSFVTSASVVRQAASESRIRSAKRDIFLDNQSDPAYIRQQIYKLKTKAKMNGSAIGIGHDRKNTLMVLKEPLPELEKEGYRVVFLSDLVQ